MTPSSHSVDFPRSSLDLRHRPLDRPGSSVATLAQAISCSNVHDVRPVHEHLWFCFVQVCTTQFCSFTSFVMARASDGTDMPVSPLPASSSHIGSPNMVLFLTLKGQDADDASLSNSTVACVSTLPSVVDHPHCMHDHLNTASNKKIDPPGSASPPQVVEFFAPSFCLKLPILSKHKENKSGERELEEMMTSLH